ncbi:hypothetical protein N7476_007794 [Penicillium atrosanguineum]|uniref:Uncharacterized protein n=1 Tax=Penicillium atrosanguineum TaxID=1132637 RepID=A0A9W9PQJ2_9EURO|nr:hypothetical protein N7476_007794 [Penicillium atrosanguineum]
MAPTVYEEYAALMNPNGPGYYLFRPQPFSECHPGAIGSFDINGTFIQITDLSKPGCPEESGYGPFTYPLSRAPSSSSTWDSRASGSEAEHSFGLEGGVSGALAGGPIDASAEAKNKWGKTGKAALITKNLIVEEKFRRMPRGPIEDWIKANAKALVKGPFRKEIAEYGLWAISKTWSTDQCRINMESAHHRDTSGGLNIGATGIAKGGANASSSAKSNSEGWTTYTASETDESLVVAYGGTGYRLATFTKLFKGGPLKETETRTADSNEYAKMVLDDEGNQIGMEYFRTIFDGNGKAIGEEKIDKEAERKAREEEQKRLEENPQVEEDFAVQSGLTIGEDDEDDEDDEDEKQEFAKKLEAIKQLPDGDEKRAELAKLFTATQVTQTSILN